VVSLLQVPEQRCRGYRILWFLLRRERRLKEQAKRKGPKPAQERATFRAFKRALRPPASDRRPGIAVVQVERHQGNGFPDVARRAARDHCE
jgi:hypothetical protein